MTIADVMPSQRGGLPRPGELLRARPSDAPLAQAAGTVALVLAALIVAYPLLSLFVRAFQTGAEPFRRTLSGPTLAVVLNSLWASALAAALAVGFGTALALATERSGALARPWLRLGLTLPILVPPFIAAFSWTQAYGRAGLTDKLLGLSWPGLFGPQGTVALLAVQSLPLVYLPAVAALNNQNTVDLERAARASGATAPVMLGTITLPLLRPYLAAGGALAFVASASDFGVPSVVGLPGRFSTITTEIYRDLAVASDPASFSTVIVLAAVLACLAAIVLLLLRRPLTDAVAVVGSGRQAAAQPGIRPSAAGLLITGGVVVWIAAVSLLPFAAMLLVSLIRAYGLPYAPENLTLSHFVDVLRGDSAAALARSSLLATLAATLVVILGAAVALAGRRRLGRLVGVLVALPYAIPGSALAVAIILGFNRWLYGTLLIILLAYTARFWILGSQPLAAALSQAGPDPVRAARASGASAWRAFITGTWPALRPAAAMAWLLVFLTAIHELTVSSLLYTPATQTIAVIVLNAEQLGDVARTAAISVLLTAIVLIVAVPVIWLRGRTAGA
jgi:iron(III) transport system permease protein